MTFIFSSDVRRGGGADDGVYSNCISVIAVVYVLPLSYVYRLRGTTRGISHEARCLGTDGGYKVTLVLKTTPHDPGTRVVTRDTPGMRTGVPLLWLSLGLIN